MEILCKKFLIKHFMYKSCIIKNDKAVFKYIGGVCVMLDNRKPIINGYKLIFDKYNKYTITGEIGRGAGCIVYNAFYEDKDYNRHTVRIKECYPYNIEITRNCNGKLCTDPLYRGAFEREKEKFNKAYKRNVSLKETLGLINSTADATGIFQYNNTLYSVITCIEGTDYCKDVDKDIQSVFIRLLALAKIIKKYHNNGILHLDIKPGNIFLIPETKEHIVLLDFDSLILKEELKSGQSVCISFSDGYAAPELVRGDKNRICEATDIYSIGAVAFYKIFKKTPGIMDCSVSSQYDFNSLKDNGNKYQPEFYRLLSIFLHKTISSSAAYRYKDIDQLIPVLEELIKLSDVASTFLYHNFNYNTACFVGRKREIEEIGKVFGSGKQVLFLSGTGGIGKTMLAMYYAYLNMEKYRKILFVPFADSIIDTVCSNEIRINNITQEEGEENKDFFKRKLDVLKSVASKDDLIILDNFDVNSDDNLEDLFGCPCKFLVTSRKDFSDYGYNQINTGVIEDINELLILFQAYNNIKYNANEEEQIKNIIEILDKHTMTTVLIAKYLRETGEKPGVLLMALMEKEGITSTKETGIKHRKDKNLKEESINTHLLCLFNLSCFTNEELEIIRSLSLLGYIRITSDKFIKYCPVQNADKYIKNLVKKGWIEYNHITGKISLHQVILDLVYNNLNPNTSNCPYITKTMQDYFRETTLNYTIKRVKDKLSGYFMQRITGNNIEYARLCVYYCQYIKQKMEYLKQAEKICLENDISECHDLLQHIYRMKIDIISQNNNIIDLMLEDDNFDENKYINKQSIEICRLAKEAYCHAKQYTDDPAYLGKFCIDFAMELDNSFVNNVFSMLVSEENTAINLILDFAVKLLDDAEKYVLKSGISPQEKEGLFNKMAEFFSPDNFSNIYKSEKYNDLERVVHYQKLIDSFKQKEEDVIYLELAGIKDLAQEAENKKEYQRAIDLYYKAMEEDNEPYNTILTSIAHIYIKMGKVTNAIECLEEILKRDRIDMQNNIYAVYSDYVCCELINLFIEEKYYSKARKYAEELIKYNTVTDSKEDNAYNITWLIAANYYLYKIEELPAQKENFWQKCKTYYAMLPEDEELADELTEFLLEFADTKENDKEKIKTVYTFLDKKNHYYKLEKVSPFLDYILKICENKKELAEENIKALLLYSQYIEEYIPVNNTKALEYCIKAKEKYKEAGISNPYLYSMIYKTLGECYSSIGSYDYDVIDKVKQKCNYYLLAEYDSKGKNIEEQIEIWEEAARDYNYLDNYQMEEKCYYKLAGLIEQELNSKGYSSFDKYSDIACNQVRCYLNLGNKEKARKIILDIYYKMAIFLTEENNKENRTNSFILKLKDCASYLKNCGFLCESFVFYIIAIIISINTNQHKDFFNNIEKYISGDLKELYSVFYKEIHGNISVGNIDNITGIYEETKKLFEENTKFKEFYDELKWFSMAYQHNEIEFKR